MRCACFLCEAERDLGEGLTRPVWGVPAAAEPGRQRLREHGCRTREHLRRQPSRLRGLCALLSHERAGWQRAAWSLGRRVGAVPRLFGGLAKLLRHGAAHAIRTHGQVLLPPWCALSHEAESAGAEFGTHPAFEAPSSSSQDLIVFMLRLSIAPPCLTSPRMRYTTLPSPTTVMRKLVMAIFTQIR